jgi:hypothetical protein
MGRRYRQINNRQAECHQGKYARVFFHNRIHYSTQIRPKTASTATRHKAAHQPRVLPLLRWGRIPAVTRPAAIRPRSARAKNRAVNIDTPLRGGELPPGSMTEKRAHSMVEMNKNQRNCPHCNFSETRYHGL